MLLTSSLPFPDLTGSIYTIAGRGVILHCLVIHTCMEET